MFDRLRRSLRGRTSADRWPRHYRAALAWTRANVLPSGGIRIHSGTDVPYPEVTGYFIPTWLAAGEHDLAMRAARWLLGVQNADGSWSDPAGRFPYTFDTGQVLKGLLAARSRVPDVDDAIRRGCDWMLSRIEPDGRVTTPDRSEWAMPGGRLVPDAIHLYALEPLVAAGRSFGEPRYADAARRALSYYLARAEVAAFSTLSHFHAYVLEALVDLGRSDVAGEAMREVERLQRRDGAARAFRDARWTCPVGTAQYAVVWYKLGRPGPADRAVDAACRLQNPSGGFYGSHGRGREYFPDREISWAAKFFLDACHWRLRRAFDAQVERFPDAVGEGDPRLAAILASLPDAPEPLVLDAGCGKGRFARALRDRVPAARIWGVDLSDALLSRAPEGIRTRQGTLLDLPFPSDHFDYVYCVEAAEHALNPAAAVSELCRVCRPGGRVILIDKNAARVGSLATEPWETWFEPDQVSAWLRRECRDVTCRSLPLGDGSAPDDLFLVWNAVKNRSDGSTGGG